MSKIKAVARTLVKTVSENSPSVLTGIGVTGTLTTAFLAAKAGYQASGVIKDSEESNGVIDDRWLRLREHARLTWMLYIPPAAVGAMTIVCVVGSHNISAKRTAALAGAYNLTAAAFQEYKGKVVEQIGANKEQKIRDDIAQDRMHSEPVKEVIITFNGDVLCFDSYSGRYFKSNMEAIRRAENKVGRQINNDMYASLNDFYRFLGLPRNDAGDDLGWDNDTGFDLDFSSVLADEDSAFPNQPCLAVSFRHHPKRDYYKVW